MTDFYSPLYYAMHFSYNIKLNADPLMFNQTITVRLTLTYNESVGSIRFDTSCTI